MCEATMKKHVAMLLTLLCTLSCATSKDSTWLGIGIGSLIGASIGASVGGVQGVPKEGAAVGALAIGALGGLIGYSEHQRQQESVGGYDKDAQKNMPAMTMPQVRRVWVPDQIEDGQYIQGHFVYIIDKQSNWMLNENRKRESKNGRDAN